MGIVTQLLSFLVIFNYFSKWSSQKKGNTFLKSLCKDFHKTEYNTSQVPIYLGKDFPYLMEMSSWFQPIYSPPEQLHKFKCLKNVPNCLAIFRHKKNGFGDVNLCSEKKLNAFGVKIKPEFFYAFLWKKFRDKSHSKRIQMREF